MATSLPSTTMKKERESTSMMETAAETAGRVVGVVEETASGIAERAREAGDGIGQVTGNFYSAVDKSVKKQPMTSLLIVGAVGFVLGALWKS